MNCQGTIFLLQVWCPPETEEPLRLKDSVLGTGELFVRVRLGVAHATTTLPPTIHDAQTPVRSVEVVAGARRFRAAQIAELADVPTRILELSDEQTVEIQIVENAQRQDVHPYEEATGYQRLLDFPGYDVAALASKCGKN